MRLRLQQVLRSQLQKTMLLWLLNTVLHDIHKILSLLFSYRLAQNMKVYNFQNNSYF
jgi:hypothetical protein